MLNAVLYNLYTFCQFLITCIQKLVILHKLSYEVQLKKVLLINKLNDINGYV